jgi:nucleotide-binding universal stress UspA family protein
MANSKFKVLLYADGSHQAFSAAVYTATLLKNMPNMHLTIVKIHDPKQVPEVKDYNWVDTWPINPTSEWMKHVFNNYDEDTQKEFHEILTITNTILYKSGYDVNHQELFVNTSLSNIADTVDVFLDYATQNSFKLIVMGTRGLSKLNGLIFGSLAHTVLDRSAIPVLLIKKLSKESIDRYLEENSQP